MAFFAGLLGGGHKTRQTLKESADVLTKSTLASYSNCVAPMQADQSINITGDGNVMVNAHQDMSVQAKQSCIQDQKQSAKVLTNLAQKASQDLQEKTVAGLSALLPQSGETENNLDISASVKSMIDMKKVQGCYQGLYAGQNIDVTGNKNVLRNITQKISAKQVGKCYLAGDQMAKTTTDITQIGNQKLSRIEENPLAPLADALASLLKGPLMIMAAILVLLVIAGIAMKMASGGGDQQGPQGALQQRELDMLVQKSLRQNS